MNELLTLLLFTLLAGFAIPFGGLLAHREMLRMGHVRMDLLAAIVAIAGGILVAAVAFVLVPVGLELTDLPVAILALVAGAGVFLLLDRAIEMRGQKAGLVMSMVADYIPESIAMGAAFAAGGPLGPLLAFLIGVQNVPEGFNSYRELEESGRTARSLFGLLIGLAFLAPAGALLGFFFLINFPQVVGILFLFAAGGILYSLFQDVAPMAYQEGHWVPTLGAVAGFLIGLIGEVVITAL